MTCRLTGAKPLSEPMLEYIIGPFGTNFSEILIKSHTFSFKKMHLKMLSGKWRPFCLSLNVITNALCCEPTCDKSRAIITPSAAEYSTTMSLHILLNATRPGNQQELAWKVIYRIYMQKKLKTKKHKEMQTYQLQKNSITKVIANPPCFPVADVLYLYIIVKSEVWPICHCLRLGHETMYALSVFLYPYKIVWA